MCHSKYWFIKPANFDRNVLKSCINYFVYLINTYKNS